MRRWIFGLLALLGVQAHAFRTAVFPPELRSRVHYWSDVEAFPSLGPVWLHAGDSVASGWATKSVLRERVAEAEAGELPVAGSFADMAKMVPSPRFPWYGGSEIGLGFLGALDRIGGRPWNVVSSALAGALLTPLAHEDALSFLERLPRPQDVKLVTFTYGHNDLCEALDPATAELALRIDRLKARFANARWVAWRPIDVVAMRGAVLGRLEALPPSLGRDRVIAYCRQSWDVRNCSAVAKDAAAVTRNRERLVGLLEEKFGELFTAENSVMDRLDVLDAVSSDCFHPSRLAQPLLSESLADFVRPRL